MPTFVLLFNFWGKKKKSSNQLMILSVMFLHLLFLKKHGKHETKTQQIWTIKNMNVYIGVYYGYCIHLLWPKLFLVLWKKKGKKNTLWPIFFYIKANKQLFMPCHQFICDFVNCFLQSLYKNCIALYGIKFYTSNKLIRCLACELIMKQNCCYIN